MENYDGEEERFQLNEVAEFVKKAREPQKFSVRSNTVSFPKGALVFREGEVGDAMYIVLEGEIKIVKKLDDGSSRILHSMTKGDFFGEMSLIDKKKRSASALCHTEVTLVKIPEGHLVKFIENNPQFTIKMLNTFVQRLRNANHIIEKAMARDPLQVVLDGLKDYARLSGIKSFHGPRVNVQEFSAWANYRLGIPEAQIPGYINELVHGRLLKRGALPSEVILPPPD